MIENRPELSPHSPLLRVSFKSKACILWCDQGRSLKNSPILLYYFSPSWDRFTFNIYQMSSIYSVLCLVLGWTTQNCLSCGLRTVQRWQFHMAQPNTLTCYLPFPWQLFYKVDDVTLVLQMKKWSLRKIKLICWRFYNLPRADHRNLRSLDFK